MNKQIKILFSALALIVLTLSLVSAMTVKTVDANNFQPGSEQDITVKIKNTLSDDATDVSLTLNIPTGTPFSIVSSSDTKDIDSGNTENFDFTIKASNVAKAGDYSIQYTLTYSINGTAILPPKTGTFTLTVEANPEISYTATAENPVVGTQGKIKLTIVNKGLGDAKFVSVKITPQGYTLLSEDNNYVGTISSDDSTTISLDAIFNEKNPTLNVQIEYKDFNNQKITKTINLPITVYSPEEALKLGIIKQNNTFLYVIVGVIGIGVWIVVRKIRKKKRMDKAKGR
jgi:hypothetical protein